MARVVVVGAGFAGHTAALYLRAQLGKQHEITVVNRYDHRRYPNGTGRDLFVTHMELGTSGAWMKRLVHETFMYKFKARPGWQIIPE